MASALTSDDASSWLPSNDKRCEPAPADAAVRELLEGGDTDGDATKDDERERGDRAGRLRRVPAEPREGGTLGELTAEDVLIMRFFRSFCHARSFKAWLARQSRGDTRAQRPNLSLPERLVSSLFFLKKRRERVSLLQSARSRMRKIEIRPVLKLGDIFIISGTLPYM